MNKGWSLRAWRATRWVLKKGLVGALGSHAKQGLPPVGRGHSANGLRGGGDSGRLVGGPDPAGRRSHMAGIGTFVLREAF